MSQIRAFVAISIGDELRGELRKVQPQIQQDALARQIVRWVAPLNIHLTLRFLGNVDFEDIGRIYSALDESAHAVPPIHLTALGLDCFPNLRHPRNIWAKLRDDTNRTTLLVERIEQRLAPFGFLRDSREFTPHLTIGRVNQHATKNERELLGTLVSRFHDQKFGEIHADSFELVSSQLKPQGPIYTTLRRIQLEARPAQSESK